MFQNHPLLAQLKQQLCSRMPRAEGSVKATEKGFGFLEVDAQKSYFIPPLQMKKVMHGDRVLAVIHTKKERESAEPEVLLEPFLTRFVGKVYKKNNYLSIIPDHPLLKEAIPCRPVVSIKHDFKEGDWAVAEMRCHPLRGDRGFYAELTEFITRNDDCFVPWLVTLARHNLEKEAPESVITTEILEEGLERHDLKELDFVTIDNVNTWDIDDALYIEEGSDDKLFLIVAIADPTAWIPEGSKLDKSAKMRAFTNYLPGFNVPILPRVLSEDLCSLRPNKVRPVLACRMTIAHDGAIEKNIEFFAATIRSKVRLIYDEVSDWLENTGTWQPETECIARQIRLLHRLCLRRCKWRTNYALIFKDIPDYRFVLDKKGEVLDVISETRRIANRIVEESMIAANICAALILRDKLGFGIYNVHTGFDPANTEAVIDLLKEYNIHVDREELLTLAGFCKLRRNLDILSSKFLDNRIRRFCSFTETSTKPGPHFGLGFEVYATWTSPIRKYGDMLNHRLIKAIIKGEETIVCPEEKTAIHIAERRRLNRMAERDVGDWLYARFLKSKAGSSAQFRAEIIDITRSGIRVRLINNGATAYIPAAFLYITREGLVCNQEKGFVQINGKIIYKVTDIIDVMIAEVRMETRSIIARPIFSK